MTSSTNFSILNKEDKIPTTNLVIYSILTLGIFYIAYIWKNFPIIEKNTGKRICERNFLFALLLCFGIGMLIESLGDSYLYSGVFDHKGNFDIYKTAMAHSTASIFVIIGNLVSVAATIMLIILSFKASEQLTLIAKEKNIEIKPNKFYLFFFNIFYINYLINIIEKKVENK